MSHPRTAHYPHHEDYVRLANSFRPFVMFTHEPHYRSASVNTDKFGLREHYDADGRFVDLETAREDYSACNVVVGGSTVFGVDATDDRLTLANHLNQPGVPCVNFGIRGAISHQELQAFQLLRRFLPPVSNVVVMTGVNLASMAALDDTVFYPEYGGIFSEPWHYDAFCDQYRNLTYSNQRRERRTALGIVDRWFQDSRWGRIIARWLVNREPPQSPPEVRAAIPFETKLALLESQFENDLAVWSALQSAWGVRVHLVLQPAAGWTRKKLAPIESKCISADRRSVPSIDRYAHREFFEPYRERIVAAARRYGLAFHDANTWFDDAGAGEELFTDICHLTDRGNQLLAAELRRNLVWKEASHDRRIDQAA